MQQPSRSGLALPNRFARITLSVFEEIVGGDSMHSFLANSNLTSLSNNLPPANLHSEFDFADFSALNAGLEKVYGVRGARGSALRVGRRIFTKCLEEFSPLAGSRIIGWRVFPTELQLSIGLALLAWIISGSSDQTCKVGRKIRKHSVVFHKNAVCWGRHGEQKPVCFLLAGFLNEAVSRITGGKDYRVDESECMAAGARACRFLIQTASYEN